MHGTLFLLANNASRAPGRQPQLELAGDACGPVRQHSAVSPTPPAQLHQRRAHRLITAPILQNLRAAASRRHLQAPPSPGDCEPGALAHMTSATTLPWRLRIVPASHVC
jgi:hypothetical protein